MSRSESSRIELLESRIAPAAIYLSPTAARYTDADGDTVTVRFTKPMLTDGLGGNLGDIFTTTASGQGEVLTRIDLVNLAAAAGTGITVAVSTIGSAGDGLADVGTIDATGIDLGAVTVKGDLGTILAGDANTSNGGLKSLTVTSFGIAAVDAGNVPAPSIVKGSAGALVVRTDFLGASFEVQSSITAQGKLASVFVGGSVTGVSAASTGNIQATGDIGKVTVGGSVSGSKGNSGLITSNFGKLGPVVIGGSLIGGTEKDSGFIFGTSIASLTIRGSILGGSAENTGLISALGLLGNVTIGNSIFGGDGDFSGSISSEKMGVVRIASGLFGGGGKSSASINTTTGPITSVTIGGSLQGGAGENSGQIFARGVGAVTIGSSLIGGDGNSSGAILSGANIGAVKIGVNLTGGGSANSNTSEAGEIRAFGGSIASVTIGGSAIAGDGAFCGAILAEGTLGPVKIGVDIFSGGGSDFIIRAKGNPAGGNAIASITVGGSVQRALILAGFGLSNEALNAAASIGPVKVGGSWSTASIAAGVRNLGTDDVLGGTGTGFDNFNFGDIHDRAYGATNFISTIASISIGGRITGSVGGTDHYGFVAGQIGSLRIDGTVIPLNAAARTDNRPIGLTGDFRVHEV